MIHNIKKSQTFLFSGHIRVCNYCYKIVQAYLNDNLEKSIEALSEDIKAYEQNYPYEFTGSSGSTASKSGKYLDEPSYRMKVIVIPTFMFPVKHKSIFFHLELQHVVMRKINC